MAIFNADYLTGIRTKISNDVASAKFKVAEILYNASIQTKSVEGDTITIILECSGMPTGDQTITEIILYDSNDTVIASKVESVLKAASQASVFFKFKIPIKEV